MTAQTVILEAPPTAGPIGPSEIEETSIGGVVQW